MHWDSSSTQSLGMHVIMAMAMAMYISRTILLTCMQYSIESQSAAWSQRPAARSKAKC